MLDRSLDSGPLPTVSLLLVSSEVIATHWDLKNKSSKASSRADSVCETTHRWRQLTFDWGGEPEPGIDRQVVNPADSREDRPARSGGEKKISKFAPGQSVFMWFEYPSTATDN
jgi:hypothetical protein